MAIKENYDFSKVKPKFVRSLELIQHENEFDVREDEEQFNKLQEIIDILVAAGYFRARIKTLSSFDKVVGGMTWCIEFCNIDVDVDLLFKENLTIGQKISLTEKIVSVLPQIQCPHPIEPHQIQGLDFIHIFPVVQWLVKRSMEYRKDVSNYCFSYAAGQFEKQFSEHAGFSEKEQQLLQNLKVVNDFYKPHRVFKRKNSIPIKDINTKVQITLLEYGLKGSRQLGNDDKVDNISDLHLEGQEIDQMMDSMDVMNEVSFDYDKLPEEDRDKIADHYKELRKDFGMSIAHTTEEDRISNLQKWKNNLTNDLEKCNSKKRQIQENIEQLKESITKLKLEQADVKDSMKNLDPREINSEKFREVERLLLHGDTWEKQKAEFEEHCEKESQHLNASIELLQGKYESTEVKCKEFDSRIEEEHSKLKVLRLQIAKKNRAISILQRRIDEIPGRAELAQYQKRFMELYNQISAKHKETKQYYSLHNTLEDTRQYMKKELSLLNSIIDNYPEAMRSKKGKEEFLQQFLNILDGVKHSKSKIEKRLSQEKRKRDELSDSLHCYIETNRKYATAIKALNLEFQKNEDIIKSNM